VSGSTRIRLVIVATTFECRLFSYKLYRYRYRTVVVGFESKLGAAARYKLSHPSPVLISITLSGSGSSFLFHADPGPVPAFHLNADLGRIHLIINWSTDPTGLHCDPPRLHCEAHSPARTQFGPLRLPNLDPNADPDPAFHSNADPDLNRVPGPKNNADPCGSASPTLVPFLRWNSWTSI
jgi:hypothetical protein